LRGGGQLAAGVGGAFDAAQVGAVGELDAGQVEGPAVVARFGDGLFEGSGVGAGFGDGLAGGGAVQQGGLPYARLARQQERFPRSPGKPADEQAQQLDLRLATDQFYWPGSP